MTEFRIVPVLLAVLLSASPVLAERVSLAGATIAASSFAADFPPEGAVDGDRFSIEPNHGWQGRAGGKTWWWECRFARPHRIGAILQVTGDHPFVLRNAPLTYVWQCSANGEQWTDLPNTAIQHESRIFRLHRLDEPRNALAIRIGMSSATGPAPTLREVEFYSSPTEKVTFPDWIVPVNTTDKPALPAHGQEFLPLARSCPGWGHLEAQQVWVGD